MGRVKEGAVRRVAALGYWRAADARVVVEAWKRSGEGLSDFSERYGIHPRRLRRWADQLGARGEPVRFHAVEVLRREAEDRPKGEPIEIALGAGCSVRVPAGFAAADLERVLAVLRMEAGC